VQLPGFDDLSPEIEVSVGADRLNDLIELVPSRVAIHFFVIHLNGWVPGSVQLTLQPVDQGNAGPFAAPVAVLGSLGCQNLLPLAACEFHLLDLSDGGIEEIREEGRGMRVG